MSDLARDAFGLLDHLGVDAAHVVGVSMGGMIVQTLAIEHPTRVRTMTSIMSTTGKRSVGWQHPALLPALLRSRGPGRDEYVAGSEAVWKLIGSPGYPQPEGAVTARAVETWERGVSRSGVLRQMVAVLTQPDRGARLRAVTVPTLVVHGAADKMVHVSGGRATAARRPRRRAPRRRGHGPRPAAPAVRHLRRRHPPYRRPRRHRLLSAAVHRPWGSRR